MGQFKALNQKNWILFKRSCCGNILQILVPLLFTGLIIVIRLLITIQNYPQQAYLTNNSYTYHYYGTQQAAFDAGTWQNLKWIPPGSNQIVGLSPASMPIVVTLQSILTTLANPYVVNLYNSDSQIDSIVRDRQYGNSLPMFAFAVSFDQATLNGDYTYKLRFNITQQIQSSDGPSTIGSLIQDKVADPQGYMRAHYSGMIGITTLINNLIFQTQTSSATNVFQNTQGPIYQQAYTNDQIYSIGKNNVALMFLLPLLIIYLRQTSNMLSQKQKKVRESMSIMGMSMFTYYFTWFIRYFITYLIVHIPASFFVWHSLSFVPVYIPLVTFLLFDIVLIVQSFFIQVFFTRAKIGVVIALLFFLVQFILSFIVSNSDNPTSYVNFLTSIVPHIAYLQAFSTMLYAQSVKMQISIFGTLNLYSISIAWGSFIINIFFWLIIYWYLEQVFPNQFGAKKHPLFCCVDKFKNQRKKVRPIFENDQINKSVMQLKAKTSQQYFQEVDHRFKIMERKNQIIKIQGLRKQFDQFVAVNNLNVNIYNDQIFVLLGHNGAGKTTTISMLTGMIQPTQGYMSVLGQTNLQKIRQMIGICPQHDTLYQQLTVQQHLQLWGTFKGLQSQQLQAQVTKLINDVNLSQKRQQYSKNLSGGQKRRLSVAMAFAGRSKVIILDQPTSGMDTSARRYIWQLLKSYKSDRIILLTTHFMDEADYLGDRIGIMAGGSLACCGSGFYLKNMFGVGYNITFVKENSKTSSQKIVSIAKKHIVNCNVLSDVSSQISIQLPLEYIKYFPNFFNQIDQKKKELGILTYGISITTLQQVFLKVGEKKNQELFNKQHWNNQQSKITLEQKDSPTKLISKKPRSLKKIEPVSQQFQENQQIMIQRVSESSVFFLHLWATLLKRLRIIRRDYKSFILQLLLPMGIVVAALYISTISFIIDLPPQAINVNTYIPKYQPLKIPIASSDITLLNNIQAKLLSKYGSLISIVKDTTDTTDLTFDSNQLFTLKQSTSFLPGGLFFDLSTVVSANTIYPFTSIVNTRIPTAVLFLQTLAAQTYINQVQNSNISITMINAPLPRTYNDKIIGNSISGFLGTLVFSIAFSFKFASIISFIVKQRQDRSKHQQIVSGMKITSYWFGNYIYDYLLYLILAVFAVLMCVILKVTAYTGQAYLPVWILFLLYGLAYIPFSYIASFVFKDYGNAQAVFYFFTFVLGGLVSTVILVLRMLGGQISLVGGYIGWALRIFPCYCFGQALINLGSIDLLSVLQLSTNQNYNPMDYKITLWPIIFMSGLTIFYTLMVFLLEAALNSESFMRFWSSQSKILDTQQVDDIDVLQQQRKALKANPKTYQILTKRLRKVYLLDSDKKFKVAVDNLSFGIKKGQVFGLLGVNGAGKTTTFKMLAGQITSTSGDSYFNGLKISQNLQNIRKNLGYCPQFDALIQNLTVRQQIQLFYDLKSLSSTHKQQLISNKIRQMNLEEYEDKLSGTLSGGNKRKLSVAMAMIGNPNIIFLDQPSTGMDPKARRFMWKVISRIASQKKQSTVILTTHSMQEAQALSTRLGIMVNGNFKCIGTPQHIKSRFGQGYQVQVKLYSCTKQQLRMQIKKFNLQKRIMLKQKDLNEILTIMKVQTEIKNQISLSGSGNYIFNQLNSGNSIEIYPIIEFVLLFQKSKNLRSWMDKTIGDNQIIESFQSFIRFKVKTKVSVGKLFQQFQSNKQKLQIQNYSIKQATVEQIFNKFAEQGQLSEMMA